MWGFGEHRGCACGGQQNPQSPDALAVVIASKNCPPKARLASGAGQDDEARRRQGHGLAPALTSMGHCGLSRPRL